MTTAKSNPHNGYTLSSFHYNVDEFQANTLKLMPNACVTRGSIHYIKNKKTLSFTALILAVLSVNTAHGVLSATTAQTIKGTAPYLEFNGIKAIDTSSLLSIKIGTDEYVSDAAGNMLKVGATTTFTTPIVLPAAGDTFAGVVTIAPADNTPKALNNVSIIPLTSRIDDDGDGNFTITGNYHGVWKDKNGTAITSLTDPLTICNAPYTLTLSTTGSASIATQYGDLNKTNYPNASAKFTINPTAQPTICFAKPDMNYAAGQYAGPATMWNTTRGFIPQSTTPSTYNKNFPTTGMNGLFFHLDVAGIDARTLTWTTNRVNTGPNDIDLTLFVIDANTVQVKLNGPMATAGQSLPRCHSKTYDASVTRSSWH